LYNRSKLCELLQVHAPVPTYIFVNYHVVESTYVTHCEYSCADNMNYVFKAKKQPAFKFCFSSVVGLSVYPSVKLAAVLGKL